jgi:hypothetical protein
MDCKHDLDAILLDCTTLVDGNIIIGMNFSGNFNPNGITNMTCEFYFPRRIMPTFVPVPGFVTISNSSRSFQLPRILERSMLTPICFATGICGQSPRKVTMRGNTWHPLKCMTLDTLGRIDFYDVPALESLSMPELRQTGYMYCVDVPGTSLNFPSLLNASVIELSGIIARYLPRLSA